MIFKLKILFYWLKFTLRGRFQSRAELESFQQKQLQQFFQRVLSKSAFYAKHITGKGLGDFPIIDKEAFMLHFDEINTVGLKKEEAMAFALKAEATRDFTPEMNDITIGLSTGTSGRRAIFLVSENERAQWVAMVINRVIKPKVTHQKIAFFLRAGSNLYTSVSSALFTFRYYDIFKPLESLLSDLQDYQPHILAAPPSVLADLATFQEQERLLLKPAQLLSFAEVLYDSDRIYIERIFNKPVRQVYQCTEGFLGVSCEHGSIHLNEDIIHFEKEYIDDKRFYPVITDFTRSSQPVVRYRLDDILTEKSEACPCGSVFTALSRIEGRANDVLLFRKGESTVRIYPDLICRKIAYYTDEFRSYKIIQSSFTELTVQLRSDTYPETRVAFNEALTGLLAGFGVIDVNIVYEVMPAQVAGSKQIKIVRNFKDQ